MQSIPFIKAQALGNDFVMIQSDAGMPDLTPELIRNLADRRRGIGCDQVIVFGIPSSPLIPVHIDFYNADGTKAQACGNGSRALANYLFTTLNYPSPLILETASGKIKAENSGHDIVTLTLSPPQRTTHWNLTMLPQTLGQLTPYITIDVGNPHLICFVEDISLIDVKVQGPLLENNPIFEGKGINISFAQIIDRNCLELIVWERGAGFTGACGTAACATMAAAFGIELIEKSVTIYQPGGVLIVSWEDQIFKMIGDTQKVFEGTYYTPYHSYS